MTVKTTNKVPHSVLVMAILYIPYWKFVKMLLFQIEIKFSGAIVICRKEVNNNLCGAIETCQSVSDCIDCYCSTIATSNVQGSRLWIYTFPITDFVIKTNREFNMCS